MALIEFSIGDADDEWPGYVMLEVERIAEYARDKDGLCAFCHGDPCAEWSEPDSEIARYFARNKGKSWVTSCPCCDGRPT